MTEEDLNGLVIVIFLVLTLSRQPVRIKSVESNATKTQNALISSGLTEKTVIRDTLNMNKRLMISTMLNVAGFPVVYLSLKSQVDRPKIIIQDLIINT